MKSTQENNHQLLILFIIIVAIMVGVYVANQKTAFLPNAAPLGANTYDQGQAVQNDSDLMKLQRDLDGTNVNTIDSGLKQNSNDMSFF